MGETAKSGDPFEGAELVYSYTREQALADGVLVDMTKWASPEPGGMMGGFNAPVAFSAHLWEVVDVDSKPESRRPFGQSTRGRAHDVLWMGGWAAVPLVRRRRASRRRRTARSTCSST